MTPKLKRFFIAVVVVQIVFLLGLVGYRETILMLGRTAVLQTVPVDPRDLFKGEYVTLRYEITTINRGGADATSKNYVMVGDINEGDTVYVGLPSSPSDNGSGVKDVDSPNYRNDWDYDVYEIQAGEPTAETDLYIKGHVTRKLGDTLTIEYGIEQYFVPEGRGLEIEQADVEKVQVRVKINRSGTAAIEALVIDGEDWKP